MAYVLASLQVYLKIYYKRVDAASVVANGETCSYVATQVYFVIFCCRQIHTNYVATWAMMIKT